MYLQKFILNITQTASFRSQQDVRLSDKLSSLGARFSGEANNKTSG
jgi:hypothetical protein